MSDGRSDGSLLRLVRERRSVRHFESSPVPRQAIVRILEAGRHSPSGANRQPWCYIVIDDPAVKQAIRTECERAEDVFHRNAPTDLMAWMKVHGITSQKPFLEEAPCLIAVFYKTREPYAVPSVWVSIAFMLLQVEQEGLGATIYTPAGARLNSILLTPDEFRLAAILPIGIPADYQRQDRRALSEMVFENQFGRPLEEGSGLDGTPLTECTEQAQRSQD